MKNELNKIFTTGVAGMIDLILPGKSEVWPCCCWH